jgi:hypothetical protein
MIDQRCCEGDHDRLVGFDDRETFLICVFDKSGSARRTAAANSRKGVGTDHLHRRRVAKEDHLASANGHKVDDVRLHYGINVSDRILASAGHEFRNVVGDPNGDRIVPVAAVAVISSLPAQRTFRRRPQVKPKLLGPSTSEEPATSRF